MLTCIDDLNDLNTMPPQDKADQEKAAPVTSRHVAVIGVSTTTEPLIMLGLLSCVDLQRLIKKICVNVFHEGSQLRVETIIARMIQSVIGGSDAHLHPALMFRCRALCYGVIVSPS